MQSIETASWAVCGVQATSVAEAFAPVRETLQQLGFADACLVHDAPFTLQEFPADLAYGCMGPANLDAELRGVQQSLPVSFSLRTGRPSCIVPRDLWRNTEEPVPALETMLDLGLTAGLTFGAPDRRAGTGSLLMCAWTESLEEFQHVQDEYSASLCAGLVYLCEGLKLRSIADTSETRLLSPREHECLAWVAAGKSSKEIADLLKLAESTVNEYLGNATHKLQASNRTQAAARALLLGLGLAGS